MPERNHELPIDRNAVLEAESELVPGMDVKVSEIIDECYQNFRSGAAFDMGQFAEQAIEKLGFRGVSQSLDTDTRILASLNNIILKNSAIELNFGKNSVVHLGKSVAVDSHRWEIRHVCSLLQSKLNEKLVANLFKEIEDKKGKPARKAYLKELKHILKVLDIPLYEIKERGGFESADLQEMAANPNFSTVIGSIVGTVADSHLDNRPELRQEVSGILNSIGNYAEQSGIFKSAIGADMHRFIGFIERYANSGVSDVMFGLMNVNDPSKANEDIHTNILSLQFSTATNASTLAIENELQNAFPDIDFNKQLLAGNGAVRKRADGTEPLTFGDLVASSIVEIRNCKAKAYMNSIKKNKNSGRVFSGDKTKKTLDEDIPKEKAKKREYVKVSKRPYRAISKYVMKLITQLAEMMFVSFQATVGVMGFYKGMSQAEFNKSIGYGLNKEERAADIHKFVDGLDSMDKADLESLSGHLGIDMQSTDKVEQIKQIAGVKPDMVEEAIVAAGLSEQYGALQRDRKGEFIENEIKDKIKEQYGMYGKGDDRVLEQDEVDAHFKKANVQMDSDVIAPEYATKPEYANCAKLYKLHAQLEMFRLDGLQDEISRTVGKGQDSESDRQRVRGLIDEDKSKLGAKINEMNRFTKELGLTSMTASKKEIANIRENFNQVLDRCDYEPSYKGVYSPPPGASEVGKMSVDQCYGKIVTRFKKSLTKDDATLELVRFLVGDTQQQLREPHIQEFKAFIKEVDPSEMDIQNFINRLDTEKNKCFENLRLEMAKKSKNSGRE